MNFFLNYISFIQIFINFVNEINDIFDNMQNIMKIHVIHVQYNLKLINIFNVKVRVHYTIAIRNFRFIFDFKMIDIIFQFIFHQLNSMLKNNAIFVIKLEKINYNN